MNSKINKLFPKMIIIISGSAISNAASDKRTHIFIGCTMHMDTQQYALLCLRIPYPHTASGVDQYERENTMRFFCWQHGEKKERNLCLPLKSTTKFVKPFFSEKKKKLKHLFGGAHIACVPIVYILIFMRTQTQMHTRIESRKHVPINFYANTPSNAFDKIKVYAKTMTWSIFSFFAAYVSSFVFFYYIQTERTFKNFQY